MLKTILPQKEKNKSSDPPRHFHRQHSRQSIALEQSALEKKLLAF